MIAPTTHLQKSLKMIVTFLAKHELTRSLLIRYDFKLKTSIKKNQEGKIKDVNTYYKLEKSLIFGFLFREGLNCEENTG